MGNEKEEKIDDGIANANYTLLSLPPLCRSPQHSGTLTPPLHTEASVPFLWEEEPGKPFPCTTLALSLPNNADFIDGSFKCLELPPRLLNEAAKSSSSSTKTPSPTTVLEGPYTSRSLLESPSLRFLSLRKRRQPSFDHPLPFQANLSRGSSPDRGFLGAMVLSNTSNKMKKKEKGLLGSWNKRTGLSSFNGNNTHFDRGNLAFSTFSDDASPTTTASLTRNRTLSTLSCANSHFWATIYGAFKQVIPRRSTRRRSDAL